METTKHTFWDLINKVSITIPIIQRDFAQGRKSEKVDEIRSAFLNSLHNALEGNQSLDFDFIYGNIQNATLIPLDGQQRLTTLFLLHWYLAHKDNRFEESAPILNKFSYETRISAKEFISGLVNNHLKQNWVAGNDLSSLIADSDWFYLSWKKDPTVQSMLVMLDAIHLKFRNSNGLFGKLINSKLRPISFQFISIDNYGLSDALYIKMNARGKPLTEFETFKARFEQFLEKIGSSRREEFSFNIDGLWTDLFWRYKEDSVIDKPFMRFFDYITEILLYKNYDKLGTPQIVYTGNIPKISFELIESIYALEGSIDFLFDTLNRFSEIDNSQTFFETIFHEKQNSVSKVALFESNLDLFERCLSPRGIDIRDKLLLFSIISFITINSEPLLEVNLKDVVRVIRNLLSRVRQQNETIFNSNLRVENIPKIITDTLVLVKPQLNVYSILASNKFLKLPGFSVESLNFEIDKAKLIISQPELKETIQHLEDHHYLKGSIHNFDILNNSNRLAEFSEAFHSIWKHAFDSQIIGSLLTVGDYSLRIGGSKLGDRRFFGNVTYDRWNTILTVISNNIFSILPKFLSNYITAEGGNANEKLNTLINLWLAQSPNRDWRYYFIRYREMTHTDNSIYTWKNEYEIRNLTKDTLLAYHINPYVRTVEARIRPGKQSESSGLYAEESPLRLNKNVELKCMSYGWLISLSNNYLLPPNLITSYDLFQVTENSEYILKDNADSDRILIAEMLCGDLVLSDELV